MKMNDEEEAHTQCAISAGMAMKMTDDEEAYAQCAISPGVARELNARGSPPLLPSLSSAAKSLRAVALFRDNWRHQIG